MEETGTVVEVRSGLAMVSTAAKVACHSCSARGVCHMGGDRTMISETWNRVGAQVGDTVRIRLSSQSVLGAAFLLYAVPLLALLAGFFLGQTLTNDQLWAILIGFLFMGGAFAGIRILDRRLRRTEKFRPEIVEILTRASQRRSAAADAGVTREGSGSA